MKKTSLISFNFQVIRSSCYGGHLELGIQPNFFTLAFPTLGLGQRVVQDGSATWPCLADTILNAPQVRHLGRERPKSIKQGVTVQLLFEYPLFIYINQTLPWKEMDIQVQFCTNLYTFMKKKSKKIKKSNFTK